MRAPRVVSFLRLLAAGIFLVAFAACPRRVLIEQPTPPPAPTPPPYVPNKRLETGRIFNGMQYRVTLETDFGTTATDEVNDPASYRAELVVKVKVPKPHKSLAEIIKLNSELPAVLPELTALLETAKISPSFDELYRLKCAALQSSLNRLDNLLTRHNFYDCETILELQHPQTKRRALFIQSEMDVDTDGSDIERVPVIEGASSTFQPFTSYRWPRKTDVASPFSAPREDRLKQVEQELATNPPQARKDALKSAQTDLKNEIGDLKKYSFLVGQTDPFVVLPGSMFSKAKLGSFTPGVGDYCVVVIGRMLYPAIVGDVGPANLMGEASLRICKQILPTANAAFRPVTELKATYLVFPGTADRPFAAPDLAKWRERCAKFLDEIGGQRGELFTWEDLTKPPPPPATPAPATPPPPASPAPANATPSPAATPAEKKS